MKHHVKHLLPISNGWSGGTSGGIKQHPTVWCGRCQDVFEVDDEWVDRYLESVRKRLLAQVGPYGLTQERAAEMYADHERGLRT